MFAETLNNFQHSLQFISKITSCTVFTKFSYPRSPFVTKKYLQSPTSMVKVLNSWRYENQSLSKDVMTTDMLLKVDNINPLELSVNYIYLLLHQSVIVHSVLWVFYES
jgi:hypothetical protein